MHDEKLLIQGRRSPELLGKAGAGFTAAPELQDRSGNAPPLADDDEGGNTSIAFARADDASVADSGVRGFPFTDGIRVGNNKRGHLVPWWCYEAISCCACTGSTGTDIMLLGDRRDSSLDSMEGQGEGDGMASVGRSDVLAIPFEQIHVTDEVLGRGGN